MQLIDRRTDDGSRQFARLPKTSTWHALRDHILLLPGAKIANFVAGGVTPAWIDFTYRDHRFLIGQKAGKLCLVVRDPQCPDVTLYQVASHCEKLLGGRNG